MKKLVITGTHSVGKTVLCQKIVELLSKSIDIQVIPEMARILMAKGIPMNDKVNEFGIVSYIFEYLKRSREARSDLVISDRSVFDLFVYISVCRPDDVRDVFVKLAEEVVYQEVAQVDTYIYVPIEFEMQIDDVRPADITYQKTIDQKVRDLLHFFGARVLSVSGSVEQRAFAVQEYLNV